MSGKSAAGRSVGAGAAIGRAAACCGVGRVSPASRFLTAETVTCGVRESGAGPPSLMSVSLRGRQDDDAWRESQWVQARGRWRLVSCRERG